MRKRGKKSEDMSLYWIGSEGALYVFFYYIQSLLNVQGNLWVSSLILWALINISIIFCPVLKSCHKS